MEWTEEMDAFLREKAPYLPQREAMSRFKDRFGIELTLCQYKNKKHKLGIKKVTRNAGWFTGINGGFKNEEHKRKFIERGKATRFKKGQIPHNAIGKELGRERVSKDGYIEVKVKEHHTPGKNDTYRCKHLIIWEREHRQRVPKNHAVLFADHNKRNFDPDNLVLVSRRNLLMINRLGLEYYDRESLEVAVMIAEIRYKGTDFQKRPRICKTCGREFKPEYPQQARCRSCIDKAHTRKRAKQ